MQLLHDAFPFNIPYSIIILLLERESFICSGWAEVFLFFLTVLYGFFPFFFDFLSLPIRLTFAVVLPAVFQWAD